MNLRLLFDRDGAVRALNTKRFCRRSDRCLLFLGQLVVSDEMVGCAAVEDERSIRGIQDLWESRILDQEEFVVIDNGTGFVKAGFSGQDLPRLIIPTVVGEKVEKPDPAMQANNAANDLQEERKSYAFGNAALQQKDTHTLFYPIERGIVKDWDKMQLMWGHIFDELNLETKNVNVLMTDSPFNPKENR